MANDDPYRSGSLANRLRALYVNCRMEAKNILSTPVTQYKLEADNYREQQINHNKHIASVLDQILEELPNLVRDEVNYLIEDEMDGGGGGNKSGAGR